MTATLVKPIKCRRCGGTGNVQCRRQHLGVPGLCLNCDGIGQVEGDPATLRARREEVARRKRRWDIALAWFKTRDPLVREGFNRLEYEEFERSQKALDSIAAGHPGVERALLDYLAAWQAKKMAAYEAEQAARVAI